MRHEISPTHIFLSKLLKNTAGQFYASADQTYPFIFL